MTTPPCPDDLARAVASHQYVCVECHSSVVLAEYAPLTGWHPTSIHWPVGPGNAPEDWCPVTWGGLAAQRAYMDLIDELVTAGWRAGDYGETIWQRHALEAAR